MTVVLRVLNVILLMINDNDYYDDNEESGHDIVGIDDHDDYTPYDIDNDDVESDADDDYCYAKDLEDDDGNGDNNNGEEKNVPMNQPKFMISR